MAAPSPDERLRKDIQRADEVLGRAGGLTAAGVFAAAGAATQVVGFAIGDPKLHLKAGLRGLIPLHLRVSARVHHVAFLHPSLDTDFAHLAGERGSAGEASTPKRTSPSKEKKWYGKNLDMAYLCGSDYAKGGDSGGGGGGKSGGSGSNSLETLVLDEKRRLSRDGIVRDHIDRKRKEARRLSKGGNTKKAGAVPEMKGKRKFVMLSADSIGDAATKKDIPSPRVVKRAVFSKSNKKGAKSSFRRGDSFQKEKKASGRQLTVPPADSNQGVVFDEEGITGDGPLLASVIMESPVAKIGRYLPETACRVPQCAVGFELRNDARRVKSTQPFVPEAPHIIWGGARDGPLKMVADDGNALVEARGLEYLTDNELDLAERTESLLVIGSTVWVDIPPKVKADAKTSKDYAKKVEKAAVKGGKQIKKGLAKGAVATADATKKIADAAADAAHAGAKGAADVGGKITQATKSLDITNRSAERRGTAMADMDNAEEESLEEEESQVSFDEESLEQAADFQDEKQVETHHKKKKGLKKMFKKTAHAMHLTKKKKEKAVSESVSESVCELESVHTTGEISQVTFHEDVEQSIVSAADREGKEGTAKKESLHDIDELLPKKNPHYTLVLDDILQLRVTSFPFSDRLATFPVSVAAILNATSMEERVQDPRRPSELTVTLVQEPSIMEGRWGVEVRVTFRVAEVRPDSPLSLEENPALDEKTGKWHKVNFKDKMKNFKIALMNAGKSHDEIKAEIKAAEEREKELQEAKEAAIIKAGIGRGYQHGAAMSDIVRRQMFYDPERIAHRQVRRRKSDEVNVAIIKAMAIHGNEFDSEMYGRLGTVLSAPKPLPESKGQSEAQRDAVHVIPPLSTASEKENKPFDYVSRADGVSADGLGVSALTGPKNSAVTYSDFKPAAQTPSIKAGPALIEESALGSLESDIGMLELSAAEQGGSEADEGSSKASSELLNITLNGSRKELSESSARDEQLSSETSLKLLSQVLQIGEGRNALQPSVSVMSETPGESSSLATKKGLESVSGQLINTLKEDDQGGLGHHIGSVSKEGDNAGDHALAAASLSGAQSVSESNKGEQDVQSIKAASTLELSNRLKRREMMLKSHQAHVVGSGHKVDSLRLAKEESKGESFKESGAGVSKIEVTPSSKNMGSGHFDKKAAALNSASQSDTQASLGDIATAEKASGEVAASDGETTVDTALQAEPEPERAATDKEAASAEEAREVATTEKAGAKVAASGEMTVDATPAAEPGPQGAVTEKEAASAEEAREAAAAEKAIAELAASEGEITAGVAPQAQPVASVSSTIVSRDNMSLHLVDSKTAAQLLTTSSEHDDPQPDETKDEALCIMRYRMMSQSQGPSGGKLSLARSISKANESKSPRRQDDFDAFIRRQRREKLQEEYHREREARLASVARSISSSSPPMTSFFLRMSDLSSSSYYRGGSIRRTGTGLDDVTGTYSAFSEKTTESKDQGAVRDLPWYFCKWIQPYGEALKAILLEEYPGLLVLIIFVGAALLLR